jgi:hypothetical protein
MWLLLHDNAPAHSAMTWMLLLGNQGMVAISQLLYSPSSCIS